MTVRERLDLTVLREGALAMVRRPLRALPPVLCAAVMACSGSAVGVGSTGGQSPCVTPGASYIAHYVEKSGTCGPVADAVVNTSSDGTFEPDPGCSGTRTLDGCSVTLTDYSCTPENGVTTTVTGAVTWASDGTSGSGTVQLSVTSSGSSCQGLYLVTFTRQ